MSERPPKPDNDDWDDDLELTDLLDKFRERTTEQPRRNPRSSPDQGRTPRPPDDDVLFGDDRENDNVAQPRRGYPTDPYQGYPDSSYDERRGPESPYDRTLGPYGPATGQPERGSDSDDQEMPDWESSNPSDPYGVNSQSYYDDAAAPSPYPARPVRPGPGTQRPRRRRRETSAPQISIPRPAIDDRSFVAFLAISLLSLLFMIASIAAGIGDLPATIPIHLDASGDPDLYGTDSTLWRIPFGVFMTIVMALGVAAILWNRDRFASRFVLAGTGLAQVLAWVAVVDYLW